MNARERLYYERCVSADGAGATIRSTNPAPQVVTQAPRRKRNVCVDHTRYRECYKAAGRDRRLKLLCLRCFCEKRRRSIAACTTTSGHIPSYAASGRELALINKG